MKRISNKTRRKEAASLSIASRETKLEFRNPELERRTDGLTVLRWGGPAFVEKQKQTIQEQIILLQKAYHRVRTLKSLKDFDFGELAHKIEETLGFTERRLPTTTLSLWGTLGAGLRSCC